MQKILRKRVLRDLKENFLRYLALAFLIVFGMYMIVSLVGAAETIIRGAEETAVENNREDGEFSTFIPLTEAEEKELTDDGITLEKMFYLDFKDGEKTLRAYEVRENINQIALEQGRLPETEKEAVLEKRYCEDNGIALNDTVEIAGESYLVCGIGTVPDYEAVYQKLSDSTVDSKSFGLAFVTKESYEALKTGERSEKAEEYVYAYLLNDAMTDEELKERLNEFDFSPEDADDLYFQEYWDCTGAKKEDLLDGTKELADGSRELKEGLEELEGYEDDLKDGAAQIFDMVLESTNSALADYGVTEELTEDNYKSVLTSLKEKSGNAILNLKLNTLIQELDGLKKYKDGITDYTGGVSKAAEGSVKLYDGNNELKEAAEELVDEYFDYDIHNLTQFIKAEDNPRIGAAGDDQLINKYAGLAAGVIIMILFTYVISVFVVHGIERESSIIGALYALGVKRRDLLVHYLTLPVVITMVAGIIGTVIGFSRFGVNVQMQDCYGYFSLPEFSTRYPLYLIIYGAVMPPLAAVLVNCMVIRRKLSAPVLALIRNEPKSSKISSLELGNMGFISRFRIRQMLRELRSSFAVLFGMFVSLLIVMMAIDCYVMCQNISKNNKADTRFEYMYTYKYPTEEAPEDGEACLAKTLKKEIYGYNLDVTVLGIDEDNPYFDADVEKSESRVEISSAMAQKYSLKEGDDFVLSDEENDRNYAFTVDGIVNYSTSFYVFMDIDSMRELFGEEKDAYNVVFSGEELDIDAGNLYSVTTKKEIEQSSDVFVNMMMPMVIMMTSVSIMIFFIVMYLMIKVMIDRSSFHISLIRIFGYRTREIKKLYLDGNFYVVAVGAAFCIPAAKTVMDLLYPYLISNIACGMELEFSMPLYLGIYAAVIILYLIINQLLVFRLKKILPAEVLKNRE